MTNICREAPKVKLSKAWEISDEPPAPACARVARISVAFRYDDCNGKSSTALERQIIDAFRSCAVPLTIGVTPFVTAGEVHDPAPNAAVSLTPEKIELLQDAVRFAGAEVALHGSSHQTVSPLIDPRGCSEFVDVPLHHQCQKIAAGRLFLEETLGVPVQTLIPPWNSYDSNTLCAALAAGLNTVSADADGPAPAGTKLRFVPATCAVADLKAAVRWARLSSDPAPLIVVLFHPFDFGSGDLGSGGAKSPLTINALRELLQWVGCQSDIATATLANVGGDTVGPERLHLYKARQKSRAARWVPGRSIRRPVYGSNRRTSRALSPAPLFGALFYTLLHAVRAWGARLSRKPQASRLH